MGLDVTAYRRLIPAETPADDAIYDFTGLNASPAIIEWTEKNWPGRTEGIKPGWYVVASPEDEFHFRAGSYSGYNVWRSDLCQMVYGISAQQLWDSDRIAGPFFELIHFPDNEGVIGPKVAAKLAKDFADWQEKADKQMGKNDGLPEWFLMSYANWRKAFEMAADGGAVDFH